MTKNDRPAASAAGAGYQLVKYEPPAMPDDGDFYSAEGWEFASTYSPYLRMARYGQTSLVDLSPLTKDPAAMNGNDRNRWPEVTQAIVAVILVPIALGGLIWIADRISVVGERVHAVETSMTRELGEIGVHIGYLSRDLSEMRGAIVDLLVKQPAPPN